MLHCGLNSYTDMFSTDNVWLLQNIYTQKSIICLGLKSMVTQYANAAVINAIMEGEDYSNGAIKWSGIDMASTFEKWREGYEFMSMDHNIFHLGNKKKSGKTWWIHNGVETKVRGSWEYRWESRAAFSGINQLLKNNHWEEYKELTENPGRAMADYFARDKKDSIDVEKKNIYFETETKHRFGTVFCKLKEDYIKAQGGEFY